MPKVPALRVQQVAPGNLPGPDIGTIPRLDRGGLAANDAVFTLLKGIQEEKGRANNAAAQGAVTSLRRMATQDVERLRLMSGDALFEESEASTVSFQGSAQSILSGLQNDDQRAIAMPLLAEIEFSRAERVQKHVGKQRQITYVNRHAEEIESLQIDMISEIRDSAEDGVLDPAKIGNALLAQEQVDQTFAENNPGLLSIPKDEWLKSRRRDRLAKVHQDAVNTLLANGADQLAVEYLDTIVEDDDLDPGVRAGLDASVRGAFVIGEGQRIAQESSAVGTPYFGPDRVVRFGTESNTPGEILAAQLEEVDRLAGGDEDVAANGRSEARKAHEASRQTYVAEMRATYQEMALSLESGKTLNELEQDPRFNGLEVSERKDLRRKGSGITAAAQSSLEAEVERELLLQSTSSDPKEVEAFAQRNLAATGLSNDPLTAWTKKQTDIRNSVFTGQQLDSQEIRVINEQMAITGIDDKDDMAAFTRAARLALALASADKKLTPFEQIEILQQIASGDEYQTAFKEIVFSDVKQESLGLIMEALDRRVGSKTTSGVLRSVNFTDEGLIAKALANQKRSGKPVQVDPDNAVTETMFRRIQAVKNQFPNATLGQIRRFIDGEDFTARMNNLDRARVRASAIHGVRGSKPLSPFLAPSRPGPVRSRLTDDGRVPIEIDPIFREGGGP